MDRKETSPFESLPFPATGFLPIATATEEFPDFGSPSGDPERCVPESWPRFCSVSKISQAATLPSSLIT